jgi:hypothetical protein
MEFVNHSSVHNLLMDGGGRGHVAGGVCICAAEILVEISEAGYSQLTNHYAQLFLVRVDV